MNQQGECAWPLYGHEASETWFLEAVQSGRLHHAWLLEGPSGIGKSILAKRMAAHMLGAQTIEANRLDARHDDPVVQKVVAEGHPDLKWIARRADDKGKLRQDIAVDDVRALNMFFSLRSALGGWRVGVIDSLDELNRSGANAILKTLEEPPANCLLVLISHGTRPVLPTIRSRCRRLRLRRLSLDDTRHVLGHAGISAENLEATVALARGRPGYGLQLATPKGIAAANAARHFLKGLPRPNEALLANFLNIGSDGEEAFEAAIGEVLSWLQSAAQEKADSSKAALWLRCSEHLSAHREHNMDAAQVLSKVAADLLVKPDPLSITGSGR